ncbi:hypothetical protein L6452_19889 [Arctium lappa]|uniref:Uncharacterized protein n=1 Tax=Arctium lappa TaxID=4217 RepID=A0ACB9B931_ARCLA|nr:hypothetical protein L6452_19889 [Arctium lappa]
MWIVRWRYARLKMMIQKLHEKEEDVIASFWGKSLKPSSNDSETAIKAEEALSSPIMKTVVDQPLEKGITLNEGEGNYRFNIDPSKGWAGRGSRPVGSDEA